MPAPVINITSSVLGYLQYQAWTFQPWATGIPTSWASSALPAGMTLNTTTGAISGAATEAGFFMVGITATNTDGTSPVVNFSVNIKPAENSSNHSGTDISIDVGTGFPTLMSGVVLKEDDDMLFYVQFKKGSTVLDLGTLTEMKLAFKEFEPDVNLIVGNLFEKIGSGTSTVYRLYVHLESALLSAELTNYESDAGTFFTVLCELEWKEPTVAGIGPATLRRSSQLFNIPIYRNLNPV